MFSAIFYTAMPVASPSPPRSTLSAAHLRLLRGVSRSFYLSIRLLPGPLRAPVAVGYLLARATDTVADTTAMPQPERQALLASLLQAIEAPADQLDSLKADLSAPLARFAAHQSDPHERALMQALPDCLPLLHQLSCDDQASVRAVLAPITEGQTLDVSRFGQASASSPQTLHTEDELTHYTWLVAGCVGEFWTALCARHLRGFARLPTEHMHILGRQYGMGLQRLNIVRDAAADLAQGRCYLPSERLTAIGLSPITLAEAARTGDVPRLTPLASLHREYLQKIHTQLQAGLRYSCALNGRRLRLASALPALIGARTVALLQQAGPHALAWPPHQRVKMPRHEVRALLWRLLLGGVSARALTREFERLSQCENLHP
jgi:farnesyl-diphosphate farnesyltransferase